MKGKMSWKERKDSAARTVARFRVFCPAALEKQLAAGEKILDPSRGFSCGPPADRRGLLRLRRSGPCLRPQSNTMMKHVTKCLFSLVDGVVDKVINGTDDEAVDGTDNEVVDGIIGRIVCESVVDGVVDGRDDVLDVEEKEGSMA
ncbi:hypothetical protein NDU88_000720 [Pleurodeles waltl]|uniref:Uncharacterized protein n=1 Tax=Pleurodeles waltl TaxID=8319 RepID=A0AAV7N8Y3_PLEWA|nr:hypothetical protein NDU88_000720 [Pleurodeles waltl]